MPLYEYECPSCKRISEVIQKVDESPPLCGDCETKGLPCTMKKMMSKGGTFILKGSGWADDGYSRKKE